MDMSSAGAEATSGSGFSLGPKAALAASAVPKWVQTGPVSGVSGAATQDAEALMAPDAPELEQDADEDPRRRVQEPVVFHVSDTTLNVMPATTPGVLMAMSEGGLQYLSAGARASVGIRSGRYMFEVKPIEWPNQVEAAGSHARPPQPRNVLRIGFSVADSMPIMGDTEDSICFDCDGTLHHNKSKTQVTQKVGFESTLAVLLNLRTTGPNIGTISLFRDGIRITAPQPLPESLLGRPLYPTVTFKNVSLHVNFGPRLQFPLPFRCRTVQDVSVDDVEVSVVQEPKDGKYNVIFPVCLPDQGTFNWCDWFVSCNPQYAELSDRKIVEWAVRSGFWRSAAHHSKASNDRPDMNFGVPAIDDGTVKRILAMAASTQRRHLIIMEVKGNLTKADRIQALRPFRMPHFRRVAWLLAGQPIGAYRDHILDVALQEKREKALQEVKARNEERERIRQLELRRKEVERAKRKTDRLKKRMEEERQRQAEAGDEAKEASEAKAEVEEDEEEPEADVQMESVEVPPKVELTDSERIQCFKRKEGGIPDIAPSALTNSYPNWSFPDVSEGFDAIECQWQDRQGCEYALRQWKNERKLSTKVEYIGPSDWFKERWASWQKDLQKWHVKHMEHKDPTKRAARTEALQRQKLAAQQEAAAAKESQEPGQGKENANVGNNGEVEKKTREAKDPLSQVDLNDKSVDPMKVLEAQLAEQDRFDVFGIEEVLDMDGDGVPLFASFAFEDWALLSLRFELHLVVHAFARDCKDPDRTGFPAEHLPYYYTKYFKRGLNPKAYGTDNVEELVELVGDTLIVCDKILESQITDDLETNEVFVKLTEEARRDRSRRIQAGDATAQLKFSRNPPDAFAVAAAQLKASAPTPPSRTTLATTTLMPTSMQPATAKSPGPAAPAALPDQAVGGEKGMALALAMDQAMGMGTAADASNGAMDYTAGMDFSAMGDQSGAAEWNAGGGGDWDWNKDGAEWGSFMGTMMDGKGGKGKSKKGGAKGKATGMGKKGGSSGWYGGGDKGSGKNNWKGGKSSKGGFQGQAWKGGWKG